MEKDLCEIEEIQFGVYSAEEIIAMSVCEITSPKLTGLDRTTAYGTVYDPRMGVIQNSSKCATCLMGVWGCPGHPGHLPLNVPLVHPLFYKQVVMLLKCFCFRCFSFLLTEDQIKLDGLTKYKSGRRLNAILKKIEKISACHACKRIQPTVKYSTIDNSISLVQKHKVEKAVKRNGTTQKAQAVVTSITLSVEDILKLFDSISDDVVRQLGFDPALSHPRNLILTVFLVIPTAARPYLVSDGNFCDDDLTIQITEIFKANAHLAPRDDKALDETDRLKHIQNLKNKVTCFYNNSGSKKQTTNGGRPIKGLKERISGKQGLLRTGCQGKRSEQTGRTVIGPDPTMKLGELGVPIVMARNLTIPVNVTIYNIEWLQSLIEQDEIASVAINGGKTNIVPSHASLNPGTRLQHGDMIIRGDIVITVQDGKMLLQPGDKLKRNGVMLPVEYPSRRPYKLNVGDICERRLMDGDIVFFNRQPSLHGASMLAMVVKRISSNTMTFNLAIARAFNADYDGDEMNVHLPASLESEAELRFLSAAKYYVMSPQGSHPVFCIVQDSLLAAYLMTRGIVKVTKSDFFSLSMHTELSAPEVLAKMQRIRRVYKTHGKPVQCFHGKGLLSLALPDDLDWKCKNKADPNEPEVVIVKGVILEGALDKKCLGPVTNGLIHTIWKEYGADRVARFIDEIQFLTNNWLSIRGFSVGLGDCMTYNTESRTAISDAVQKCYIEAEGILTTTSHPGIREARVTGALSKARDIGLKIAKEALAPDNAMKDTVTSGAKGDYFNIAQITGLLGQQNILGKRVQKTMTNATRTLPHYPILKPGESMPIEMEYESRGFVTSSFIGGLKPREFYYHIQSGREGVTDTATNTAKSGYMMRRMTKLQEDMKVHYDGTVRDATGCVYQWAYGGLGIDPKTTVKVNGKQQFCDAVRIANRLNNRV